MVPQSISRVSLPWMLDNISLCLLDISTLVSYNHTKLNISSCAPFWVNGPVICQGPIQSLGVMQDSVSPHNPVPNQSSGEVVIDPTS